MCVPSHFGLLGMAAAALLLGTALAACGDDVVGPDEALTVSGTVNNRSGVAIPQNARIVVAWVVSSGSPDYTYVFGEGTLRNGSSGFSVRFDEPPPPEALNSNGLGVGIPLLVAGSDIQPGMRLEDADLSSIRGAAGQYAIIYVADDPAGLQDWVTRFPRGYSVGRGVKRANQFDAFEPVAPGSVELIVDDLENIEFVNWT